MRLLRRDENGSLSLTGDLAGDETPDYAILSHRWLPDGDEPDFGDLTHGRGDNKPGYEKLRFCGEQSRRHGLEYFWVDTCCINKENQAELSHAINSMFRWYRNATRCYVYLPDVSITSWELDLPQSGWFTRGWTLQELLAPRTVDFFSKEAEWFGDKCSLERRVHEITGIPKEAIQGVSLTQFADEDRYSWMNTRKTTLEEDMAYSLLGIFDVYIAPRYGEGRHRALERIRNEVDRRNACIRDLHLTDPSDDKKRIEDTKGGLLKDSCRWILDNVDFQQWLSDPERRLLWIRGDPGKGKTMLLCGIIDELSQPTLDRTILAYFFFQATNSRINNATAMLRGLIYMLVTQQPLLIRHVQKKYDTAGKSMFEDANAWVALSETLTSILQDPTLNAAYLVVDALDECVVDLHNLSSFISQTSSMSSRAKWVVSSRNWPTIEERLAAPDHNVTLSLELNAKAVSAAVSQFIHHRVYQLAERKKYGDDMRAEVLDYLSFNADNTFLWVALVCQQLENVQRATTRSTLHRFPPGLDALYSRMLQHIRTSTDDDLCTRIIATAVVAYRPITLEEVTSLVETMEDMTDDLASVRETIGLCGSFLTVREGSVYFVHQSAKDFLVKSARDEVFPSGEATVHYDMFVRSLQVMSNTLKRDIYDLHALDSAVKNVGLREPDPLAWSRYSCIYWIDHLCEASADSRADHFIIEKSGGAMIDEFVRSKYLYWLEALSLCEGMSKGVVSVKKLEALLEQCFGSGLQLELQSDTNQDVAIHIALLELVRDASRFIMHNIPVIQMYPLQAYVSALLFSPSRSLIRGCFKSEEPDWVTIIPPVEEEWDACLQTLHDHSERVDSVAIYPDSKLLASASGKTVMMWDTRSGRCFGRFEGHTAWVLSVAFNSTHLASASLDKTVKLWSVRNGNCLLTLAGHNAAVNSVAFSSTHLASASSDRTVKLWDTRNGSCLLTLAGHSAAVNSVAFSSLHLASASHDKTVKLWDTRRETYFQTFKGHTSSVNSVVFSSDSTYIASASHDNTIKVWDPRSDTCIRTLEGHSSVVTSVAVSPDCAYLASASWDKTIKVWDSRSGNCLQTLQGHSSMVNSVAYLHDSTRLASASDDYTVKVWETRWMNARSSRETPGAIKGHSDSVYSLSFSPDSTLLASASSDDTVRIWETRSGQCVQTIEIRRTLNVMLFNPTGSYLRTDVGTFLVHASSRSPAASTIKESGSLEFPRAGLSLHDEWISCGLQNVTWLPSEYRPHCSTVSGDTVGIGGLNGKVWICRFRSDDNVWSRASLQRRPGDGDMVL